MVHQEYIDMEFESLIPSFMQRQREELVRLKEACRAADGAQLELLGHRIKGTGRNYGFTYIGRTGEAIEALAKEEAYKDIMELLRGLERYLDTVHIVYVVIEDEGDDAHA